jgi:membrane-associated protein
MTEQILALAVAYGLPFLALAVGMSCLGIPMPSSLLMLAAGSLAASGDFSLPGVFGASLLGAIAGDQMGYVAGRYAGARVLQRLEKTRQTHSLVDKARGFVRRGGFWGVFFTRWLLSALGPYVNLIAGGMSMSWLRFSLAVVAGEIVWVGLYVGLGVGFSAYILQIADIASNAGAFLGAAVVVVLLGRYLWTAVKSHRGEGTRS